MLIRVLGKTFCSLVLFASTATGCILLTKDAWFDELKESFNSFFADKKSDHKYSVIAVTQQVDVSFLSKDKLVSDNVKQYVCDNNEIFQGPDAECSVIKITESDNNAFKLTNLLEKQPTALDDGKDIEAYLNFQTEGSIYKIDITEKFAKSLQKSTNKTFVLKKPYAFNDQIFADFKVILIMEDGQIISPIDDYYVAVQLFSNPRLKKTCYEATSALETSNVNFSFKSAAPKKFAPANKEIFPKGNNYDGEIYLIDGTEVQVAPGPLTIKFDGTINSATECSQLHHKNWYLWKNMSSQKIPFQMFLDGTAPEQRLIVIFKNQPNNSSILRFKVISPVLMTPDHKNLIYF